MAEGPVAKRARVSGPGTLGEEAISFQVVRPGLDDLGVPHTFRPLMTHQLLGEDEMIYGYDSPEVIVELNLGTYEVSTSFKHNGIDGECTEIESLMADSFQGATTCRESLRNSEGAQLTRESDCCGVEVRKCAEDTSICWTNLSTASSKLKAIHKKAEMLLPFFIDGASSIEQDDQDWELFTAIKEISGTLYLIGFCTVYRVYAFPHSSRLRVSQVFVLPPFQRQGVGRALLEAVYWLADKEDLQDVIYEEPTSEVEMLREKIEFERCCKCPWLEELAQQQHQSVTGLTGATTAPQLTGIALPGKLVKKAQKELHLTKQQVRKAWEVMLAKQPAFQQEPAASVLRGLLAKRLFSKFSDTERHAVGKQIFNVENKWGDSYYMLKVPKSAGLKGMPVALEDTREKGQSKEEREQAWEEAIEARWQAVATLAGLA